MTYLWADDFSLYNNVADGVMNYDAFSFGVMNLNTPVGFGKCMDTGSLTKTWGTQENTLYISLFGNLMLGGYSNLTDYNIYVTLLDGTNAQCSVIFAGDTSITARSGNNSGSIVGTAMGLFPGCLNPSTWGTWWSAQIKIVIHDTTGSIEVRINGKTTPILNLTNINTRAGSSNYYATKITVGTTGWARFSYLWLNSGSGIAPNTWPGEPRAYRQSPSANSSVQFSHVPNSVLAYDGGSSGYTRNVTSTTLITTAAITAPIGGTITGGTISLNSAMVGKIKFAIYANDGILGGPGSRLAISNEITNPPAGMNPFTFASPPTAIRGNFYFIAVMANATTTFTASFNNVNNGGAYPTIYTVGGLSYAADFPANISYATHDQYYYPQWQLIFTVANYSTVAESTYDGDATIVQSATVGQEDLYTLSSVPTIQQILGVNYATWVRKSDTGNCTGSIQLIANGSVDTTLLTFTPAITYLPFKSFQALDPTGASWTIANINSAIAGIKLSS